MNRFIYFIRRINGEGPIKIGCSYFPATRLREIASWSPYPLGLIAECEGDDRQERRLHNFLYDSHSHGEWFHPTEEVLSVVAAVKAGVPLESAADLSAPKGRIRAKRYRADFWGAA